MPEKNIVDEKKLFSELIEKQSIIFGTTITREQLKTLPELQIDKKGTVVNFSGDKTALAKKLLAFWHTLSPFLAKKIAEPLLLPITTA